MNWQLLLVLVIVVTATAYLGWRSWRTWTASKRAGCGGGCGCAKTTPSATANGAGHFTPAEQLTLRRRESP